jgi:hypothetical protein
MKRLFCCLALFALIGCDTQGSHSDAETLFQGTHELRKMQNNKGPVSHSTLHGSFFLFTGAIDGSSETHPDILVTFAWKGNDGTYLVSTLPVSRFRFKFDNTITAPTVKFRWQPCYSANCTDKDTFIEYVVLTCRESDWPTDVELPLNQGK